MWDGAPQGRVPIARIHTTSQRQPQGRVRGQPFASAEGRAFASWVSGTPSSSGTASSKEGAFAVVAGRVEKAVAFAVVAGPVEFAVLQ